MAKSARSKTRKFWASERRRALGVPAETKQLEEQARRLQDSLQKQAAQPSILRLKAVFKRPQAGFAQPRRPSLAELAKARQQARREKATPKPAAGKPQPAELAEAAQEKEGEEEEELVVEMEVDPKKIKGRKPRTASRVKKSGSKFAAKKQKGVKK